MGLLTFSPYPPLPLCLQTIFIPFVNSFCEHYAIICAFLRTFSRRFYQVFLANSTYQHFARKYFFFNFFHQLLSAFLFNFFHQLLSAFREHYGKNCVWVPSAHPSTCDSVMFLLPFCQLVCTVCILMSSLPILQCVCTQICLGNKIGGILSVWGCSRKWGGGKCLDPPPSLVHPPQYI
jgi:hypothetical protein